jgi:CRP-like cAMP-binding protein
MPKSYEDPLTYLPRTRLREFGKGRSVYDAQQHNTHLYLVVAGRVCIAVSLDESCQTISRIVRAEGLFGESCLIGGSHAYESATAMDHLTVMAWSRDDIERQIEREPRLGLALSQFMVRQCLELEHRIESMAIHKTPERIMLAFLQLSDEIGAPAADGAVRLGSLTHRTIAEYVGTSREIVTFQMNRMRRLGLLRYSRQFIDVNRGALAEELRRQGVHVPPAPREVSASA